MFFLVVVGLVVVGEDLVWVVVVGVVDEGGCCGVWCGILLVEFLGVEVLLVKGFVGGGVRFVVCDYLIVLYFVGGVELDGEVLDVVEFGV